jgi:putative nucleotidyltransferase-like protein
MTFPGISLTPPLADTLRLIMPCASTTLLLRAALNQGEAAGGAWSQWRSTIKDPKAFLASDRVGIKRHLPLLYRNLVTHHVEVGRDLEPYFRAARAREELRSTRFRRFLGEALGALNRGEIDYIAGKGITLGETIHPDPVLRHSHDIDLLVRSEHMEEAASALSEAGFAPRAAKGPRVERRFDHGSGLPVELHSCLYCTPFYNSNLEGVWSRARADHVVGVPVRVIGDIDLLVHAPVHASLVARRQGLSWIVDIVSLIRRREVEHAAIDWTELTRIAIDTRAALPLYVMYRYLATTFGVSIPDQVIAELRRSAANVGVLQQLAALDGLRADPRQRRLKSLAEASDWRSRAVIARAMLLPPPAYFRVRHPGISSLALALMYVDRPFRFIARQVNRFQFRLRRRLSLTRGDSRGLMTGVASTVLRSDNAAATGRSFT